MTYRILALGNISLSYYDIREFDIQILQKSLCIFS